MKKLEIAREIQKNNEAEAEAITGYTQLLQDIEVSDLEDSEKQELKSLIEEIVGDELDHQEILKECYTNLTEIKENGD